MNIELQDIRTDLRDLVRAERDLATLMSCDYDELFGYVVARMRAKYGVSQSSVARCWTHAEENSEVEA